MSERDPTLDQLIERVRSFAQERCWESFHQLKNLTMALAREVGELVSIFQWLTPEQSATVMQDSALADAVQEELTDVLIHVLGLAVFWEIPLDAAVKRKLVKNASRYAATGVAKSVQQQCAQRKTGRQ